MKEDHSFEVVEEKNTEVIIPEEKVEDSANTLTEEVVEVKEEIKEEVKEESLPVKEKVSDKPKKKINIGLIFLVVFIGVIAFIYIFLGQPTFNFHANGSGDKFTITFSKIEERKAEKLQKELDSKKVEYYRFEDGFYISNKGAYILRNGNSVSFQYGDDAKIYTANIEENDKEYYVLDDEQIPYVSEYFEYVNSDNKKVKVEMNIDGIEVTVDTEHYVFLTKAEEMMDYEGIYRNGDKYVIVYNTYDFADRLNQVKALYYDGVSYGSMNLIQLVDSNGNGKFDDDTKDGVTVLNGKLSEGSNNTFKFNIVKGNLSYDLSFEYNLVDTNTSVNYDKLVGSYTK